MINFKGCVASPRDIYDWEYSHDPASMLVWFYLLHHANYKDKRWNGIEIKRGQIVTSVRSLSEKTGLSERKIRTSLTRLKSTHLITQSTTAKYSVITIINYGDMNRNDTQNDTVTTHKRQQLNKDNKDNNKYSNNFSSNNVKKNALYATGATISYVVRSYPTRNPSADLPEKHPQGHERLMEIKNKLN